MPSPFSRTLRSLEADGHRRWAAGLIPALLLLATWTVWFLAARVSVYEVSDRAWLAVDREAHPIAAPVPGRIASLRIALGQQVAAGEVLAVLEGEEQRSRLEEERARWTGLGHQAAALRQQIAAGQQELTDRGHASRAGVEETRSKLREAEAAARLADQQADRQARLLASGLIPPADAERARSEAEQRHAAAESLRQTLDRLGFEEQGTASEQRGDIDELERDLALLASQASEAQAAVRRLERDLELRTIRAPVAGRIGQIAPVRVGSVVAAGDPLAMVVPAGEIKAIAEFLPASALGRIQPDQRARIVLQSFPAAQYGDLPATVTRLASEPRDGRIRVELALEPDRHSRLPLQHGLPGTVEVEVERVSPAVLVLRTVGKVFERPVPGAPEVAPGSTG
ncbi:MAG TPA: HlyD family efflux transporter periplasmic adaptor subunit [Thermoanaerobaculia bacterium]|nr:HlyD family efflux transporter periplasmic adaptor subunit [Thermoanaerobaculia bacterium]